MKWPTVIDGLTLDDREARLVGDAFLAQLRAHPRQPKPLPVLDPDWLFIVMGTLMIVLEVAIIGRWTGWFVRT